MSELDLDLVEMFVEEAEDLLYSWERSCLELESEWNSEALDELRRAAHTLKGSAKGAGLEYFGSLVHQIENFIELQLKSKNLLDKRDFCFLLKKRDYLAKWVTELCDDPSYVPDVH